ncbi:hypothetical protein DFR50_10383 [Roseiarcus fermentans]|uniref:Uncharacterized protein n=1 Tax=Roseiarcus fermentans TaxID=1473586 RepID=A0A366FRF1_9HYPH|nr:hypothetical protein DFR50_10383 [Roseiarcus fermentans]
MPAARWERSRPRGDRPASTTMESARALAGRRHAFARAFPDCGAVAPTSRAPSLCPTGQSSARTGSATRRGEVGAKLRSRREAFDPPGERQPLVAGERQLLDDRRQLLAARRIRPHGLVITDDRRQFPARSFEDIDDTLRLRHVLAKFIEGMRYASHQTTPGLGRSSWLVVSGGWMRSLRRRTGRPAAIVSGCREGSRRGERFLHLCPGLETAAAVILEERNPERKNAWARAFELLFASGAVAGRSSQPSPETRPEDAARNSSGPAPPPGAPGAETNWSVPTTDRGADARRLPTAALDKLPVRGRTRRSRHRTAQAATEAHFIVGFALRRCAARKAPASTRTAIGLDPSNGSGASTTAEAALSLVKTPTVWLSDS